MPTTVTPTPQQIGSFINPEGNEALNSQQQTVLFEDYQAIQERNRKEIAHLYGADTFEDENGIRKVEINGQFSIEFNNLENRVDKTETSVEQVETDESSYQLAGTETQDEDTNDRKLPGIFGLIGGLFSLLKDSFKPRVFIDIFNDFDKILVRDLTIKQVIGYEGRKKEEKKADEQDKKPKKKFSPMDWANYRINPLNNPVADSRRAEVNPLFMTGNQSYTGTVDRYGQVRIDVEAAVARKQAELEGQKEKQDIAVSIQETTGKPKIGVDIEGIKEGGFGRGASNISTTGGGGVG